MNAVARLAVVETAAEAEAVPGDCLVVALEPDAQVTLEQNGRAFRRPEEYVDWHTLETAGLETFSLLEELCDRLDVHVHALVPEAACHGLRPARWLLYVLKRDVDSALARLLRLQAILAEERPGEVLCFGGDSPTAGALDALGTIPTVLPHARRADVRPATRTPPSLRARAVRRLLHARRHRRGDVLLLDGAYGIPLIRKELDRLGLRTSILAPVAATPAAPDAVLWAAVESDAAVRALLRRPCGDLWALVAPALRRWLELEVPRAVAEHARVRALVERARPAAALTSVAALPEQKARCHALRSAGVPVLVSRHGELGLRDVPLAAYQDLESVECALCWGEWEAAWTARHAHSPVRTTVTGSPYVEHAVAQAPDRTAIRRSLGIDPGARVALYAPTGHSGGLWYAGRRQPDDSTYFAQQTSIVQNLRAAGVTVIVKEQSDVRPTALERWCGPLDCVDVIYEPTFAHLIHLADLVILDLPSTTLAQALFGPAPVYVVDHPLFVWEPGVREHLTAHGVSFSTVETLAADIGAGRARGGYLQDAREPLTHGGDGLSARRAAQAIAEVASAVA